MRASKKKLRIQSSAEEIIPTNEAESKKEMNSRNPKNRGMYRGCFWMD
jgi:hypothetical protein